MSRRTLIPCPRCGSHNVRRSHRQSLVEIFKSWLGFHACRCRDCRCRYVMRPWAIGAGVFYAKCPRCMRLDLTTWNTSHYRPSNWMYIRMWLGARRWRCEPCRTNFVSWRPRKERYRRPTAQSSEEVRP